MNSTYFNILSSSNEFNQCDNPIRSIDSEPTQIMLFIIRLSSILMYSVLFLSSKNIYSLLGFALLILQLLFFIDSNNGLIFSILLSILSIRIVLSAGELISYPRVEFMEFIGLVLTSNFNILTTQSDEDDSFYAEYKVSKNASSSVSTLLSICNMKDELEYTDAYATKVWRRVPSDSKTSTWISKAPSDGILFHTSCIFEATPDEVLLLISEEHSPSGLEHISFQYENLCVSKNNNIFIKNFFVESGSVQASNRILTVVSGIVSRENGIIILHSRSSNVPEHIDFKSREPCEPNGYIRGILYASGFIIKPLECTLGSTKPRALVQFAIHLDLLGSITGRANRYNRDVLLQSIQTLFRNVQSRCAERNSLNLPSAPRTMETDMVSPSSCSGSGSGSGVNSSCRSTPRASHNSCPITLNVPVHLNAVESRITQSAEKHLQSAHTLILELRAEQKAAIDVFYRSQSLEALSDIPKLSPKKTWRAVTSRTQLFGGGSGTKEDKNRPRSRSVSPHATPIRSGAAVIDEPVDLLLHRSSIKVWNHKRHNVLSAVMHLEVTYFYT